MSALSKKTLVLLHRLGFGVLVLAFSSAFGQDAQFSQMDNSLVFMNPAMVGAEQDSRFVVNHRGQWLKTSGSYITTAAAADFYIKPKGYGTRYFRNSGFGVLVVNDFLNGIGQQSNMLALAYATEVKLRNRLAFRSALQLGVGQRSVDYQRFTFGDMLTPDGRTGNASAEGLTSLSGNVYPSVSIGGMLYSPEFQLGAVVHHANQPNIGLLNETVTLPLRFTLHARYHLSLDEKIVANKRPEKMFSPFIVYRQQGPYQQFELGSTLSLHAIDFGLWFRGLPYPVPNAALRNADALILYSGINYGQFKVGVSYDLTVNDLGLPNTGGSYEFSVRYLFNDPKSIRVNGFTSSGLVGVECLPDRKRR